MLSKGQPLGGKGLNVPYTQYFDTNLFKMQGLSLSGGESSSKKGELTQKMQEKYPNCSSSYFICTDTFGSIAVASESGRCSCR